jgi:PKD domain/Cysteine-rich secretory protein family
MRVKFFWRVILSFSLLGQSVHAAETENAYIYLNQLRQQADMLPLQRHPNLETAAMNHAMYNNVHGSQGHEEQPGLSGFTGAEPKDRTAAMGYRSLLVSENVSWDNSPNSTVRKSIDGLMSAIYHRFGFLTFTNNEIGAGISKIAQSNAYVYNLGNSHLNQSCQRASKRQASSIVMNVCQPDVKLDAQLFKAAISSVQGNNPLIVIWPPHQMDDVPPAFYEETPDPLPDYAVSGYPISVQFNPLSFNEVALNSFRLFKAADNSEVFPKRILNHRTDPNQKFTPLEFALFPLKRLEWNTEYRAEVEYLDQQGANHQLTWQFKTRDLGVPVYTVAAQGDLLQIPNGINQFAVYIPPTSNYPYIGESQFSYPSNTHLNTESVDANTLLITFSGQVGQQANFTLSGGRKFTLQLGAAVNQAPVARFRVAIHGLSAFLDASRSNDPDGTIVSYVWTSNDLNAEGRTARLNFNQPSSYQITLTITDNQGETATSSQVVHIKSRDTATAQLTERNTQNISTGVWRAAHLSHC